MDEHDVFGFEIPMDDALRVRFADSVAKLHRDVERARQWHRSPRGGQRALQGQAVQILHDDVHRSVRELAHQKHVHNVGMGKARGDLRLAVKTGNQRLVRGELPVKDLHCDVAVNPLLKSPVNATHRPDADELANLDVAENLPPDIRIAGRNGVHRSRQARQRSAIEGAKERIRRVLSAARGAHLRFRSLGNPSQLTLGAHKAHATPKRRRLPPAAPFA